MNSLLRRVLRPGVPAVGVAALAAAVLAQVLDRGDLVVAAAAVFAAVLLVLTAYGQLRMGRNYRQLRADNQRLRSDVAALRRNDDLTEVVERLVPVVTRTVARDWSANASRIAARYELLEGQARTLLDELEQRAGQIDEGAERTITAARELHDAVARESKQLARDIERLPTTSTTARLIGEGVSEVDALLQIRDRYPSAEGAPVLGGWALRPRVMLETMDLIATTDADLIVECGSGSSTVYIGEFLRRRGTGRLVSLEHDRAFHQQTARWVEDHGLSDHVDVRYAPLVEVPAGDRTQDWYDPEALGDLAGIDVLIVDGPPGATGALARFPALPQLHGRLSADAVVLVDDATRTDEKAILAVWMDQFDLERVTSTTNHLAVLRRGAGLGAP